jgi:hypothetical protein
MKKRSENHISVSSTHYAQAFADAVMAKPRRRKENVLVTFRLPLLVQRILIDKAAREDLNFSQFVRRALRKEIAENGIRL